MRLVDRFERSLLSRFSVLTLITILLFGTVPLAADVPVRAKSKSNGKQQTEQVQGVRITPASKVVVNVQEMADREARNPARTPSERVPPNRVVREEDLVPDAGKFSVPEPVRDADPIPSIANLLPPSPSPSASFLGHGDVVTCTGAGFFTIPPDTNGAVGPDRIVTYLNNNYVVLNKATGAQISCVSGDTFWAASGATGTFDPRIVYDQFNGRWIISAVSNAQNANSSVIIGISNTSDPSGAFTLFRFIVGCASGSPGCTVGGEWADFPMMGYNKNWVAVSWNQFNIGTNAFIDGNIIALDYPTLRTGTSVSTRFGDVTGPNAGFCMNPAITYSTIDELYLPAHLGSAAATYRLHSLTGTPALPVLNLDLTSNTRPGGAWVQPGGNILPQVCAGQPACLALQRIDSGDAFIRSNVIFRGNKIWYAQTVGLPAGAMTHTAVQWTALNPDGSFNQGGRIDDPTATNVNGGLWYAYPSLAVNANEDVLIGYSEFESDDFPDAAYSVRLGTDSPGTLHDPLVFKDGEGYYQKTFGTGRNRWGDYSVAAIDPSNTSLWTLQQYSAAAVGTGDGSGRWSTWWARVDFAPTAAGVGLSGRITSPAGTGISNVQVTLTDPAGNRRSAITNGFGYYSFVDVPAGASYVVSVRHKRYSFTPDSLVINVTDELTGVDFVSSP